MCTPRKARKRLYKASGNGINFEMNEKFSKKFVI